MAAAAPSSLASSVEKTNGAKLSRLLIDGGTTVLRNVFDRYHPPANLAAGLNANYLTLDNLYKKKVLHKPQWDLLFPPGGVTPDSKTFDITLLFLLLTNICGLSPPLSGWHKPPPSSDTSLEANLTRIKLYRNELYGHVPSTGVQTAVFNVKWQEISAVLVALGLNAAEVVRLKSAPCGEDYISAVMEWVKSDEEIKSQLGELRQTQQEARQMREEDHKTLQDTHDAVKGVRQIHKDTHEIVKEVLKTQQEACQIQDKHHRTIQVTQQAVEDVRQINKDTHQVVKEVLKTQQEIYQKQQETVEKVRQIQPEDHETLQDSKLKLDKVHQTQTKTKETIERLRQTQLEDRETLQESKSKLEELHETQTKTQQVVKGVAKTQEDHFETLQAVKQAVDSLKEGRDADRAEDQVLQNLAKSEFKGDIEYHVGRYQEGTREWVFNEVENWLDDRTSQNRVMVISANAGMGKSVISAVICKRMQEAGRLSGSHFCQHNNARYRNPQLMLQSLACHLSHALSEYKQALVKQLSRNLGKDLNSMGVAELFALLFKEPLSAVGDPGRNMLMVIDGLDESDYQERNELLDVIASHLYKLPCWIRFLCTTRPERNISEALKHLKPFKLESNDDKNMEDIKRFLEKRMQYLINPEKECSIVEKLVEKAEGLMLYAYFLVSFIEENVSVLDQGDLDGSLPLAISSVYHSYFKRLENELKELGIKEDNFLSLLCIVTASREPLPIGFLSKLLVSNANSPLARRKVLKCIGSVSSLLPIRDGCLHVIHKSVKDWLTNASCYGEHDFIIDEKEGHSILASLCTDELDHLKQKGVHHVEFSSTEKYALHHGARHMLHLDENVRSCNLEKHVQTYVLDLELLYAKLCVNNSLAAEDILWLLRQENYRLLSENSKGMLNTLIFLLRKYYSTLTGHPRVFFQTVLNEGGSVLSPMASNLLQNKYPEIPYMEFRHNQIQQGAVVARFQCSSQVVCFDVSPQSDYLVCECENGTIQMWSLHTGKLVWEHPVMINKTFYFGVFRKVPSSPALSHYRSVVFHPTMEIVLPGVLSCAYGMDGDLIPLFPESKCSFTVCSVSGDKTSILTDCRDDARCIILWSVTNGSEISRTTRCEDVLSFAWSQDGRLLAISHSTGLICLVDVVTGFRSLAEVTTSEVCGMIKFAPDHRFLFCKHTPPKSLGLSRRNHFLFRLNVNIESDHTFSLDVFYDRVSYVPWKFESHSEGGFLSGDPLLCVFDGFTQKEEGLAFVLTEQSVLISYRNVKGIIEMLSVNELTKQTKAGCAPTSLANITSVNMIAFSLNAESIYAVSGAAAETVSVLDITSGELKAEKSSRTITSLVLVREGVLLTTRSRTLELWNFQLSVCVRRWPNLSHRMYVIPVSEDLVAYLPDKSSKYGKQVTFLDTASGEIVSTMQIPPNGEFVACNRKCQLITINNRHSLHLLDGKVILWYKDFPHGSFPSFVEGLFSPAEQFLILFCWGWEGAHVLDAASGRTLQFLCRDMMLYNCKFVSDEECAITTKESTIHHFLRLFNVKSGDQLTVIDMENKVICLDTNPRKHLIAIGLEQSKFNFKLIQVKLPRRKEIRKSQRMADTPKLKENRENQRMTNTPEIPERTGIKRIANTWEVKESGGSNRMANEPGTKQNRENERMTNTPEIIERTGIKRIANTWEVKESGGSSRMAERPETKQNRENERMSNTPEIPERTGIKRIANTSEVKESGGSNRMAATLGTKENRENESCCRCLIV